MKIRVLIPVILIVTIIIFFNVEKTIAQSIDLPRSNIKIKKIGSYLLYSDTYDSGLKLWYNVRLIKSKDTFKIKSLPSENGSEFFIKVSNDQNYFIIDNIIKGYVTNEEGKDVLYENYTCAIVDARRHRVVHTMQTDCGGEWNKKGQWISGKKLIFDTRQGK